ncbi:MAG: ATP-binding protein [Pirellulaceae bacterium]|nr:ATP-binding protein [Pirellulaceae bacterium]
MKDLFENEVDARSPLPGFRLSKLEIYNWGTFDGAVYSVTPRGQTTLLVGENGSGKSTLVDALLTLLVRPQTRNYNVAAGATKNERDEKTYIRGAYDRTVGDAGRPQIQYLRSGSGHYTALLACFANEAKRSSFTVCQVLYLNSDSSVEKIYAFADGEHGIVQDLGQLSTGAGVAKVLRDRGYQTTTSYKQYFNWIQRQVGFRAKAMDIFNQTVAVKDVQRLDLFIRQHMLELKPWKERVDRLLGHFSELSEAHRMLVRVRQQDELLRPIAEAGERYHTKLEEVLQSKKRLDAASLYFASETNNLLTPLCDKWQQQIHFLAGDIARLEKMQNDLGLAIARITLDIENLGGTRVRELPALIEQAEQMAGIKRSARARFESQLQTGGIKPQITSPEQFHRTRELIHKQRQKLVSERDATRELYDKVRYESGSLTRQLSEDRAEYEALLKRKNNLPESLIALRDAMCRDLKLAPSDLPYAAELISVAPEESDWEASIEQVLYGFARSLLVPTDYYSRVAGYVDSTRLQDGRGQGQRLVYLKIGARTASLESMKPAAGSLATKLLFREDHPLGGWVRSEVQQRFDYTACDTIEEFQRAKGAAMTRNRHLKSGPLKHEKDDRSLPQDRRQFVLGWDNRQKRLDLAEAIRENEASLQQLHTRAQEHSQHVDQLSAQIESLDQAYKVEDFDSIDNVRHEFEASKLKLELQEFEQSNDEVRVLKSKRDALQSEAAGYQRDRDGFIAQKSMRESELRNGTQVLNVAQRKLSEATQDGTLSIAEEQFDALRSALKQPLTLDNFATLPTQFTQQLREECDKHQERLQPIARDLTSAMTRFLKKFPDEQADLDANVESLSSFEALYARIATDDLPKHEERFKRRLNEKVLHEIGLLHGSLEDDRDEIRDKIEQLNTALRLLEWKAGTYMRLEPSDVADREIQDFRRELSGCLSGTLDGTAEANEATFVKIEKLIIKLRDENNDRWRQKVIDVRNWFNFAARELVAETGEARSYYDGGTGQSGGEKGKLAFLVLVAAIAYQYDLEPDAPVSDRFHFVMVDEMFSRSDDQHAEYALELFERFGLQLLIVAPLDAKARVTEPYVGTYLHVVKDRSTNRSQLLSITAEQLIETVEKLET